MTTYYEPHEQRVIEEHRDLVDKLGRLTAFMNSQAFSGLRPHDQVLLRAQARFMRGYADTLAERIDTFGE